MAHLHVKTPGGTTYSIDLDTINANGGSIPDSGNNGWGVLTNGAILQWGYTEITTSQQTTVDFHINFTTACYNISATTYYPDDVSGISNPCGVRSVPTKTNCVFTTNNEYAGFYWIAIGK